MSPEQTLLQTLLAAPEVSSIVASRIYMDRADQDASAPFVVLGREDAGAMQTLCAAIDNPDAVFDMRCWADSRLQAETLVRACIAACHGAGFGLAGRTSGYSDEYAMHASMVKVTLDEG